MGKKIKMKKVECDPHWNGKPDFVLMDPTTFKAYRRVMNPTYGMTKKEKRLYKLLHE